MTWPRRILIAIAVVVILIGAVIVLTQTIDLGRFKGSVEKIVSERTGREFVIAGRFEPSIGGTIDLVAEDVRLGNADWGTADYILELERVVISVDTRSLLSEPIEVLNLEVEGLSVHIEKNADTGRSSWSFEPESLAPKSVDEPRRAFELPLLIRRARLQSVGVTYGQGWLEAPRNISVRDASLGADESDLLRMSLSGNVNGDPIEANGLIGPLSAFIDGQAFRWELDAKLGQFLTSTEGGFRDLFRVEGPDIHATMQGPSAERALARFGLPPLARGAVNVTLDVTETKEGVDLRLDGSFGNLTTEIVGHAKSLLEIRDLEVAADIRGPDLQAVGTLFGAGFLPQTEFAIAGELAFAGDGLELGSISVTAGDAKLNAGGKLAPARVDPDALLDVSASGPEIRDFLPPTLAQRLPPGTFDVEAVAAGGPRDAEIRNLRATLGEHALSVEGTLPLSGSMTGLDIAVTATGPDIDQLVGPWVKRSLVAEPYSIAAKLSNAGDGFVLKDATVELATARVVLDGTSGTLPGFTGMNLSIDLSAEDLQAILEPWVNIAVPAAPFDIAGKAIESNGALSLSDVAYQLGPAQGQLDGTTGTLPSLDGLQLNASMAGPDLSQLRKLIADPEFGANFPAASFETHSSFAKTSAGWFLDSWELRIGDSKLEMRGALGDIDVAQGIDIDVAASGPDLRLFVPGSELDVPVPFELNGGMRITDTTIELQEVDLRIGQTTGWLDGRLPISDQLMNAAFDVRVAGPNLERVGQALDIDDLPPYAFRFEGAMKRSGQAYRIDNLAAVVGENDLRGDFRVEMGEKIRVSGQLESDNLNLTQLFGENDDGEDQDEAPASDRVIPDTPLPLELLDLADVDLTLRMRHLLTNAFAIGDVELKAVATDDELHVDTTRVLLRHGGTVSGDLDVVRTAEDRADVRIGVAAEEFRLRPPVDTEGNAIERPLQDLDLSLSGGGSTIRELAQGANGTINLRVGKGQIDNQFGGYIARDLVSQVFTAINPLAKDSKYTQLNCAFVDVDIVDGVARSRAVGLQTDELAMASVGTIDLATETLDLSFRVKQREGIGISLAGVFNPYFRLGGTMANPALKIDTKRGLLTGTVAVLTGGMSILAQGVWDRYLSQDNYCEAVLEALDAGEIPAWEGE